MQVPFIIRSLRSVAAISTLSVLLASPVLAQTPVLFGVDSKSVSRARTLGLPVHYGSAWAGAWNQKWGWTGVEQDLRQAYAAGVIPVVHWWYWGDDISPSCVENGCADRYHGVRKDKATWTRLSIELAALIRREGGSGAQAIVVLETEFNKNGIETHEPFDGYLAEISAIFHSAGLKVALGFGDWGVAHWGTFDRAVASVDMLATTALRSSLRDAAVYHSVADELVASARYFKTRFNKPTFIGDLALSSYPAAEYEAHQAAVIREIFARLPELRAWGVIGIVFRMLADDPAFDINNYHGVAERHWGFLRADGSPKPAFAELQTGWLAEAQIAPTPAPTPIPPVAPTPIPETSSCPGSAPVAGWVCVNNGWVPSDHPLAVDIAPAAAPAQAPEVIPTPTPAPPPAPAAAPTPAPVQAPSPAPAPAPAPVPDTSSCPGDAPVSGWVCVTGDWVPPDHPRALAATTSTPAPTPTATPTPAYTSDTSSCPGSAPVTGWVCVRGDWVPPDHPLALAAGTSTAPATPAPTQTPTSTPPPATAGTCPGTAPGVGWVCTSSGGWVPPDHPLAKIRGASD